MGARLQRLWLDGAETELTPRAEVRLALRAGYTMNAVESNHRRGLMSDAAFARYKRLWAVSTATEHPYTAAWTLARWRSRRARTIAAIRTVFIY
jgi:hypothetical protein